MKKRILAVLLAATLSLSLIACGSEEPEDTNTDNSVEDNVSSEDDSTESEENNNVAADDGIIDFEGDAFKVTYTKHETGEDWEGKPCLIYYFEFTNNGEEATSAMVTSYLQCFQNGIECETTFLADTLAEEDNYMKDIQPGVTLEVCQIFLLEDNSEVTIEASDWVSFSGDKDVQTITLE